MTDSDCRNNVRKLEEGFGWARVRCASVLGIRRGFGDSVQRVIEMAVQDRE